MPQSVAWHRSLLARVGAGNLIAQKQGSHPSRVRAQTSIALDWLEWMRVRDLATRHCDLLCGVARLQQVLRHDFWACDEWPIVMDGTIEEQMGCFVTAGRAHTGRSSTPMMR